MMIKSRELKLAWLLLLIDTFPSWFNEPYEWQLQLIFIGLHSGQKSIKNVAFQFHGKIGIQTSFNFRAKISIRKLAQNRY